jgi:Vitamin K epoxide reductase family
MSARSLRITLAAPSVAGLGIAGYLTYVHYAGVKPVCTAGGSCEKVQTSAYSELAGVPVALLGLLGYTAILGLLTSPENEVDPLRHDGPHARRLRIQRLSDASRAVFHSRDMRVVRVQRSDSHGDGAPVGLALLARHAKPCEIAPVSLARGLDGPGKTCQSARPRDRCCPRDGAAGVPGRTAIDTLRRHARAETVVLLEAAAELMSFRRRAWNVPRRSADSSSRQSLWLL